ncbi:hypothetical protein [Bradyrhizobium sp. BRP23]|uniref:hypothetical protein n=1 Tax=Bradyrhizobium sp. BRP23 TaxID=2793820 RepID=UPI001CD783C7|nr:hypothetical protein [Bradyrhizobium sp. BRP23]MCA1419450.1 hypothetical protein [Bradyrhizobium sp. BRP23]
MIRKTFYRSVLTAALPVILLFVFFAELASGLRKAAFYAWLEVRNNVVAYRDEMRRDDL